MERISDWIWSLGRALDDRIGLSSVVGMVKTARVPGGPKWVHALGSVLVVVLLLQFATGALLAIYYVPSPDYAHATVEYVQKVVTYGWLVRGLHSWGASALVVLAVWHLAVVVWRGAYKPEREVVWLSGLILVQLVLAHAFTGYLLPWDQRSYFGATVGANLTGMVPVVGGHVRRAMLGGESITALTLSRFYALHTLWLPAAILGFLSTHVATFARAGVAGRRAPGDPHPGAAFFPRQFVRNAAAALIAVGLLIWMSWAAPAALGPSADPTAEYLPRPEWYFLSLYQLLKYFPARLAVVPGVVLPALVGVFLAAIPFIDDGTGPSVYRRALVIALSGGTLVGIVGLTGLAIIEDRVDPATRAILDAQSRASDEAMNAPFSPVPLSSQPDRVRRGLPVQTDATRPPPLEFSANCASCHGARAEGGGIGPSLVLVTTKPDRSISDIIELLNDPRRYGLDSRMPEFSMLGDSERREIAIWLASLSRERSGSP